MSSGGGSGQVQETPLQVAQAKVAQQQWQDYNQRWVPVQNYYIQRTEGNLGNKKAFAEGTTNADVQGQFGNAQTKLGQSLSSREVGLGSGKDIFSTAALSMNKGNALNLGTTNVDTAVQRQYESGLQGIVSQGRGQQATSDQTLGNLAALSGQQAALQAQMAEQNSEGLGEAVGTGVGVGGGALARGLLSPTPQQSPATGLSPTAGGFDNFTSVPAGGDMIGAGLTGAPSPYASN